MKKYHEKKVSNQINKCLNQIIRENKPYNLRRRPFTKLNIKRKIVVIISRGEFEDKLTGEPMVERQARDLEVRVRILVQVQNVSLDI